MNELDLCAVLANFIDNAVAACKAIQGPRRIALQATTPDGAALPTEELQRSLDRALKDTAAQLRTVKADRYEPGTGDTVPPGLYRQAGGKVLVLSDTEA